MKRSKRKIVGWILSFILVAFLCFGSASGKFTEFEGKDEMFDHLGWSTEVMFNVGVVEVIISLLYLIPRVAFIAAILLTAYLGGATATHVRVGDPFFFQIIFGVVIWVTLGLRDRRVFRLAFRSPARSTVDGNP